MPTLPAVLPFDPSGGDLPVRSEEDVRAAYPREVAEDADTPVLDGFIDAQGALFAAYQRESDYAAAQSDPTRATGVYLDEYGADVGIFRQEDEDDEAYRTRIFAPPSLVTPNDIKTRVDALLAPYTSKRCVLWESIGDRWFVNDDSDTAWKAFVGEDGSNLTPYYPDRRYALRGQCEPGGPFAFDDSEGRFFILRIPDLSGTGEQAAFAMDEGSPEAFFVFDRGSEMASFVFDASKASDSIYSKIVNAVSQLKGHGIRVRIVVDPKI